jgi:hypothetical protein
MLGLIRKGPSVIHMIDVIDFHVRSPITSKHQSVPSRACLHHTFGMHLKNFSIRLPHSIQYNLDRRASASLLRPFHTSIFRPSPTMASPIKRKAKKQSSSPRAKKPKIEIPEYHLTSSRRDKDGEIVWPAPNEQIERAREIIREWYARLKAMI